MFQARSQKEARDLLMGEVAPCGPSRYECFKIGGQKEEMVPDVQDSPLGQVRSSLLVVLLLSMLSSIGPHLLDIDLTTEATTLALHANANVKHK